MERNYEGTRWTAYDRSYRWQALARKDLNWSVPDPRLYSEAFTGRARAIARCVWCLEDDHTNAMCPKNPHCPVFGFFPDPSAWLTQAASVPPWQMPSSSATPANIPEICRRYNEGKRQKATCKCRHICTTCHGLHRQLECPQACSGRTRSPHQATPCNLPPPPGVLRYSFNRPQ